MKIKFLFFIVGFFVLNAFSAEKAKVAHMHVAKHNGKVLMLGDVHFEVTGNDKELSIYYYDRFGDDLPSSKIEVTLELGEGEKRRKLEGVKDKKVSNLIHVSLPSDLDKNTAELIMKAKNIDMPKGQNVGATLVRVAIKSMSSSSSVDPHANHKM